MGRNERIIGRIGRIKSCRSNSAKSTPISAWRSQLLLSSLHCTPLLIIFVLLNLLLAKWLKWVAQRPPQTVPIQYL